MPSAKSECGSEGDAKLVPHRAGLKGGLARSELRMLSFECRTSQSLLPLAVLRDATVIATSWFASSRSVASSVAARSSIFRRRSWLMSLTRSPFQPAQSPTPVSGLPY